MAIQEKADQPFQVDFALILSYIALLTKKVAQIMNSVFEDYQLNIKNL